MANKNGSVKIGMCGVDSGQLLIIDPCYLDDWKTGEFVGLPGEDGVPAEPQNNYDEACRVTCQKNAGSVFNDLAVVTSSGFGDGYYPVYATFEGGRVKSVEIVFIDDEEEEDGEDA